MIEFPGVYQQRKSSQGILLNIKRNSFSFDFSIQKLSPEEAN